MCKLNWRDTSVWEYVFSLKRLGFKRFASQIFCLQSPRLFAIVIEPIAISFCLGHGATGIIRTLGIRNTLKSDNIVLFNHDPVALPNLTYFRPFHFSTPRSLPAKIFPFKQVSKNVCNLGIIVITDNADLFRHNFIPLGKKIKQHLGRRTSQSHLLAEFHKNEYASQFHFLF